MLWDYLFSRPLIYKIKIIKKVEVGKTVQNITPVFFNWIYFTSLKTSTFVADMNLKTNISSVGILAVMSDDNIFPFNY